MGRRDKIDETLKSITEELLRSTHPKFVKIRILFNLVSMWLRQKSMNDSRERIERSKNHIINSEKRIENLLRENKELLKILRR